MLDEPLVVASMGQAVHRPDDCASFLTRSPSGAVRTSGVVTRGHPEEDAEYTGGRLAWLANTIAADASGKIAVVVDASPVPLVHVFQRRRDGLIRRAWCGNALAAAAAFAGSQALTAIGPGRRQAMVSVALASQVWSMPGAPPEPEPYVTVDGSTIWSSHVLNDYLAVQAPSQPPLPVGNGKTVVVDGRVGSVPLVVFGTAMGHRDAAPLTGLAELRVLAAAEPFAVLDRAGAVQLRDGSVERLPTLAIGSSSFAFELPGRLVELAQIVLSHPFKEHAYGSRA